MKLRNIFTALAVAALTFVGCQQEERFLDEVQVSQSTVAISVDGGSAKITVDATAEWKFANVPEWLTVNPASGAAGTTEVTFTATATEETREVLLDLVCAGATQQVNVLQMAAKVETPISTCKEVNAGVTGKVYRVKGVVTSIANTLYGNLYIDDGTDAVYVYGTLYNNAEKQFEKHGIEVGDIVTVEGPMSPYNGSPQLKNVTVIDIEKSLIKVEKVLPEAPISLEGGKATAVLTVKDGEFSVVIPEEASWLTAGEPYTVGTSTFVDLTATANEGGARKATVTFKTKVDEKEYVAMADIEQLGAIAEVSVAEFLAAAEGTALYKLTGKVGKIANTTYGNFDLIDATGTVYVYGLTNNGAIGSNDKKFADLGINEGDVVTIIGTRASYNGTAQVGGTAYLVSHVPAVESTVADFLAESVAADKWYKLTGKVTNIVKDKNDATKDSPYGNFDLTDETGTVYVYGLTVAPVASNDKSFPTLGLKEGDIVTLVGTRAEHKGTAQVGGPAYYISHETPAEGGDDNTGDTPGDDSGNDNTGSQVTWTIGSANQSWAADTHTTYGAGFAATVDGIKVGYYKNASQTEPIEPKADHIRVYQDSYLVITPAEGKKIKSVVVECTGDKVGPIKVGDTEYTATDKVITWTGDVAVFEAYAVKQTRVAKLTIVTE